MSIQHFDTIARAQAWLHANKHARAEAGEAHKHLGWVLESYYAQEALLKAERAENARLRAWAEEAL